MMNSPKVCILRTAGTNCDKETAFAFVKAQAQAELVHVNQLIGKEKKLDDYHILAIPGGFSYGDDLGAGKILANELRFKLIDSLNKFINDGKLIIGICNGFQILVKSGLLPGNMDFKQQASLIINDSGKFEARWSYLRKTKDERRKTNCVWAKDLPEVIYLPVAHGEGKFVVENNAVLEKMKNNGQIVFQYCGQNGELSGYPDNPNGSIDNIAGICDETGRILGLMPHPERHIDVRQHPRWLDGQRSTKYEVRSTNNDSDGFLIFKNGVEYARNKL
ncbi:MAG: phosphoribosylformylglycinamidine synthase I [Candidatus Omnitrophota bacterium]